MGEEFYVQKQTYVFKTKIDLKTWAQNKYKTSYWYISTGLIEREGGENIGYISYAGYTKNENNTYPQKNNQK